MLGLERAVGIASSEELVRILINERYLVGVDFHHDNIIDVSVNVYAFVRLLMLYISRFPLNSSTRCDFQANYEQLASVLNTTTGEQICYFHDSKSLVREIVDLRMAV